MCVYRVERRSYRYRYRYTCALVFVVCCLLCRCVVPLVFSSIFTIFFLSLFLPSLFFSAIFLLLRRRRTPLSQQFFFTRCKCLLQANHPSLPNLHTNKDGTSIAALRKLLFTHGWTWKQRRFIIETCR